MGTGQLRIGVVGVTIVATVVTGCSATVRVSVPDPVPGTGETCAAVVAAAPSTLAGSAARDTLDEHSLAWGDPPITLRCGIPTPDGLHPGVLCTEVNGVGWWEQPGDGGTVWTTIGREAHVEVAIPEEYGNPVDLLVDLAPAISEHDPVVTPCR